MTPLRFIAGGLIAFALPIAVFAQVASSTSETEVSLQVEAPIIIVEPIEGCTDSEAENYNSEADTDNGSCIFVVPATNFTAEYDVEAEQVELSWQNPDDFSYFEAVRIVRKIGSYPTSPTDGTVVYDGPGENVTDPDVDLDTTYFYALFVRSTSGRYSTAVITSVRPSRQPPLCDDDEEDCDPGPFSRFPSASSTDPLIVALNLGDFVFSQPGERDQFFGPGGRVLIKGNKTFTVSLDYSKVPEVLKAIGITLYDPVNPNKTFSFLLRLNSSRTAYTATIAPLGRTGTYRMNIYVMNFKDQTIKRISGNLIVATAGAVPPATVEAAGRIGKAVAVGAGIVAISAQTFGLVAHLSSLADLYLLFMRLIGALLGFLGLKRRSKPWGTVYDAVTKRPIDPAYISVLPAGIDREQASAITDIDGRYGFFLPAGTYVLKAGKTHYAFPSRTLYGRDRDELYHNLYFGEPVAVAGEEVVNKDIPLDPIGFDWNEFTKSKSEFFKIYSQKEIRRNRLYFGLYTFGFAISVGSFIITPSWFDVATIVVYISLFVFRRFWRVRHEPVQITNRETGEPLPYAIVRFFLSGSTTEVRSVVTDELGRFYALLRPGEYYYTIEEKIADGSYRLVHTSPPVTLGKGVVKGNIVI